MFGTGSHVYRRHVNFLTKLCEEIDLFGFRYIFEYPFFKKSNELIRLFKVGLPDHWQSLQLSRFCPCFEVT